MSNDRKRVFFLTAILAAACVLVVGLAMYVLYDTHIEEAKANLKATAQSQARLIEAVARYDKRQAAFIADEDPQHDPQSATMRQIVDAHENYRGFGKTGEFTLAHREGDQIVFQFRHRHDNVDVPAPIPFASQLAEPMRRALNGLSGTMSGLDYRGEIVLAAHEPVIGMDLGIVAKIDLAEVRAPFVRAGMITAGITILVVVSGVLLFIYISSPMIRRLESHTNVLRAEVVERKLAEGKIQKAKEQFENLVDNIPDAVYTAQADDFGTTTFMAKQWRDWTGYTSEEFCNNSEAWLACVHPDDRKATKSAFIDARRNGKGYVLEYRVVHRDTGQIFILRDHGAPNCNEKGEVVTYDGIVTDITTRKKAEEALAQSECIVASSKDMLALLDKNFVYLAANPEYLKAFGLARTELVGQTVAQIFGREFFENIIKPHAARCLGGAEVRYSDWFAFPDAGKRYMEITYYPYYGDGKEILGLVVNGRDLTERRRAEEQQRDLKAQLFQSEKLASIGQLAAGVAHEINNPMGFISSNLNTMNKYLQKISAYLSENQDPDQQGREKFDSMITDFGDAIGESLEGAERITKIVSDLKGFSRTSSEDIELADINAGLESTLNIVWNQLKYHCKIEKDLGELQPLLCIPNQLNQVFLNLLVNAGQAISGDSGLIQLKTWAEENNIFISIKDNGAGIPEENLSKLFNPFFTTKEVGQGTGLGLSLAFEIIKKHHGRIDVKSKVGEGAEFIISLPLDNGETIAKEKAAAASVS